MIDMVRKEILPAVAACAKDLAETALSLRALSADLGEAEGSLASRLSGLYRDITAKTDELETALNAMVQQKDAMDQANAARFVVTHPMAELRTLCDAAESKTAEKYWPYPTYAALLFGVE